MPPPRHKEHEWTQFELHTMLCLIAKGVHLEQRPDKRTEAPTVTHAKAYENFYTALNKAVHGDDYTSDIHKKEVTRMLDQMLAQRKHVVGRGGLVERQRSGRVTRTLRMAWNKNSKLDFDGTENEWRQGRKAKVMGPGKDSLAEGDKASVDTARGERDNSMTGVNTITEDSFWKESATSAATNTGRLRWRSELDPSFESLNPNMVPVTQYSAAKTTLESFAVLSESLRSSNKFGWAADPAATRDRDERYTDQPLKRAGMRDHSRTCARGFETSDGRQPERMRLPYESYHNSRDGPVTPNNVNKHGRGSDTSTPGFTDDYSPAEGVSPEAETPVLNASNTSRFLSSGNGSPRRVFAKSFDDEIDPEVQEDLERTLEQDLAYELSRDVDMGGLEDDSTAAMKSR